MKPLMTALCFFLSGFLFAQRYTERVDPANSKRTIVELPPIKRTSPLRVSNRNVLDEDKRGLKPIPFVAFEWRCCMNQFNRSS